MRCWTFHIVLVLVVSLFCSSCWILITTTTTFNKQSTRATTHPRRRSGDNVAMYLPSRESTVDRT
jgi:hypothetical protein